MNFSFPYSYPIPYRLPAANTGNFITKIFGNLKFSNILNGASKTLNFVNQTIPVIKQISPMINNAKTMFNVLNEFKKTDTNTNVNKLITIENPAPINNNLTNNSYKNNYEETTNGPTFFI